MFPPLTYKNRWFYYILCYVLILGGYLTTNHFEIGVARELPLTDLDKAVPFLPWTGWIYSTVYFFPLLIVVFLKSPQEIKGMVICFLIAGLSAVAVFLIYPTTYPRPPLPELSIGSAPMYFVHFVDSPKNCFPSAHVMFAFLSAFALIRYNRLWGQLVLVAAVAVAISTLTTKQHYVWDVVVGYIFARMVYKGVEHFVFPRVNKA